MIPSISLDDPRVYERDGIPHDQLAWLRQNAPVYWHPPGFGDKWPGFWAVTRYADIQHISRHPEVFSSQRRLAVFYELPDDEIESQQKMMLHMDPPRHTRLRALAHRGFAPRAVARLKEHISEICDGLLNEVMARSEVDFVRDIAAPLPLYVICELAGAPLEDRDHLFRLTVAMRGGDPGLKVDAGNEKEAAAEFFRYVHDLAARRSADPQDDLVTQLQHGDDGGDHMTAEELDMFFLLLIIAGSQTTRDAAAGGMLAFFQHPEQWQELLADRSLIPTAAEELVRWTCPVNMFRRTAVRETELGGKRIREGDKVVVYYSSANRDEEVFTDPFQFDIRRTPNPHLGFGGGGPHFCLGRHLAALELRVLIEALAERTPAISLAGPPQRLASIFANGLSQLPVRFTP